MRVIFGKTYYTVHEVSAHIGLSVFTVRDHIRNKRLKAQKLGREYLILEQDLKSFVKLK